MLRPPDRVDLALALAAVVPALAAMAARLEPEARPADGWALLLTVALGLPMLVRRRWPVGALLVTVAVLTTYYLLGYSAVGLAVPIAPALYSAGEAGRVRAGALVATALVVLAFGWRVLDPLHTEPASVVLGYDLAATAALMAAVLALGDAVRSRRGWQAELDRRLRLADEEREQEARRRVAQERMRIARDVHDALGHAVAVISLHASVAAEALDDDPEASRRALTTIRGVSREVLRDLRGSVGLLGHGQGSGSVVEPVPDLSQVPRLVRSTTADGLDVRLCVEGDPRPVPAAADATAYRLVQEALTNVLRHASARHVVVTLRYEPHHLVVTVADDGRGCAAADAARPGGRGAGAPDAGADGHGLRGMRERVALLGGDLAAGNRPGGGGFEVRAVLPADCGRIDVPA